MASKLSLFGLIGSFLLLTSVVYSSTDADIDDGNTNTDTYRMITSFQADDLMKFASAQMVVPKGPRRYDGTIFYLMVLGTSDDMFADDYEGVYAILQYSKTVCSTFEYQWSISTYFNSKGHVTCGSDTYHVKSGDLISMNITQSGEKYTVNVHSNETGQVSSIDANPVGRMVYNLFSMKVIGNGCDYYPANTTPWTNTAYETESGKITGVPKWVVNVQDYNCFQRMVVNGNGDILANWDNGQ